MKTIKQKLENFDLDNLDMFEEMQYNDFSKNMTKSEALQILINNIEGDFSQLSEELAEIAEEQENEQNRFICGDCGGHVNEYTYNEEKDIDECNNCKL